MSILNRVNADTLGLAFVLVFSLVMITFALVDRRASRQNRPAALLRPIRSFEHLNQAIKTAVEGGRRFHISLGSGNLNGMQGASALLGLSLLKRLANSTWMSDRPTLVTSGEGTINLLSRDTLMSVSSRNKSPAAGFEPASARLTGVSPFSYAAGTLPLIHAGDVSASLLAGHFGPEAALIVEAGARTGMIMVAGSDYLPGQAVLFAAAQDPLIGEELYASGAYLAAGTLHTAGVQTQDIFRWILILSILGGVLLKALGIW